MAEAEGRAEVRRRVIEATDDTTTDNELGATSLYLELLSEVVQASMDGIGWQAGPTDSIEGKVREKARSELVLNCGASLLDLKVSETKFRPQVTFKGRSTSDSPFSAKCQANGNVAFRRALWMGR